MKNILGWGLIIIGLLLIFGDIFVSYNYFTGKDKFPEIFKTSTVSTTASTKTGVGNGNDIEQQLQNQVNESISNSIQNQLNQILPGDSVTTILNASIWSIFAFFLLSAGVKLVNLGKNFVFTKKQEEDD